MTAKNLKTEQTTFCGLEFGPRNEEREKEIEKRKGWFLELCPANLFFYPLIGSGAMTSSRKRCDQ